MATEDMMKKILEDYLANQHKIDDFADDILTTMQKYNPKVINLEILQKAIIEVYKRRVMTPPDFSVIEYTFGNFALQKRKEISKSEMIALTKGLLGEHRIEYERGRGYFFSNITKIEA